MDSIDLPIVGITEIDSFQPDQLTERVRRVMASAGDPLARLHPGMSVLIKPDLTCNRGSAHLALLKSVVEAVRDTGAGVVVGDSPWLSDGDVREIWRNLNISDSQYGPPISFEQAELKAVVCRTRVYFLPAILHEVDLVINLARLREDRLAVLAGALAGILGVIPGHKAAQFPPEYAVSEEFNSIIVDLFAAVSPGYNLLQLGDPDSLDSDREEFALLAGDDAVALDMIGVGMVGGDPKDVPALSLAAESGLGVGWPEAIRTVRVGESRGGVYVSIPSPRAVWLNRSLVSRSVHRMVNRRPTLDTQRCEQCGRCVEVCPSHALQTVPSTGAVRFRQQLCAMCYHCRSVCRRQAI